MQADRSISQRIVACVIIAVHLHASVYIDSQRRDECGGKAFSSVYKEYLYAVVNPSGLIPLYLW